MMIDQFVLLHFTLRVGGKAVANQYVASAANEQKSQTGQTVVRMMLTSIQLDFQLTTNHRKITVARIFAMARIIEVSAKDSNSNLRPYFMCLPFQGQELPRLETACIISFVHNLVNMRVVCLYL